MARRGNLYDEDELYEHRETVVPTEQQAKLIAEAKPVVTVVVAGHVDAGKSSLVGRMLTECGAVSRQESRQTTKHAEAAGKSAEEALAWLMDEDEQERDRGVTVDVGTRFLDTDSKLVTLLDTPGHKDLVPATIAGASSADAALLVVAALEAEFAAGVSDNGQTREHAALLRSLGVRQMVVAVNKMDLAGWSQERFEAVRGTLLPHLRAAGFKDKQVRFVPVSATGGQNVRVPINEAQGAMAATAGGEGAAAASSWYAGPTLMAALEKLKPATPAGKKGDSDRSHPLLMTVLDASKGDAGLVGISGTRVSVRVEAGFLAPTLGPRGFNATLVAVPGRVNWRLRSILVNGEVSECLTPGAAADLVLSTAGEDSLRPGDVLCAPGFQLQAATEIKATVNLLPSLPEQLPIVPGMFLSMHALGCDVQVQLLRIVRAVGAGDKAASGGGESGRRPRRLVRGDTAIVRLRLVRPLAVVPYKWQRRMGRFLLRYSGSTLAAGMVMRVYS